MRSRVTSTVGLVLAVVLASGGVSTPVQADAAADKARCAHAYEQTQRDRKAGKLVSAREEAVVCRSSACPDFIVKDCSHWIDEIDAVIPSVVVSATNARDKDVTDVAVYVDDKPLMDHLTGRAVNVDPGRHTFRFEREDADPIEKKVLIREGEQARVLHVHFAPPGGEGAEPREGEAPAAAPDAGASGSDPTPAYILGGAGVVALGAFAYFAATGVSDENDARKTCAPDCTASRVDGIKRKYTYADISLGLGAVCVGIAAYLLIHDSGSPAAPSTGSVHFDVAPSAHGAVGALTGHF